MTARNGFQYFVICSGSVCVNEAPFSRPFPSIQWANGLYTGIVLVDSDSVCGQC